jgi:hypothetical protein
MIAYPRRRAYSNDIWDENLKTICAYVFANNELISNVELPENVEHIESNAFEYSSISKFSASSIKTIGERAFQHCNNLYEINILSDATLNDWVFYSCSNLTTATLLSKVVGNNTF